MPPRDARKYLYDIAEAAAQLSNFVSGKTLEDYVGVWLLQAGVERQFEIVAQGTLTDLRVRLTFSRRLHFSE
jgi:uncharacterized protein with HEPN domain